MNSCTSSFTAQKCVLQYNQGEQSKCGKHTLIKMLQVSEEDQWICKLCNMNNEKQKIRSYASICMAEHVYFNIHICVWHCWNMCPPQHLHKKQNIMIAYEKFITQSAPTSNRINRSMSGDKAQTGQQTAHM